MRRTGDVGFARSVVFQVGAGTEAAAAFACQHQHAHVGAMRDLRETVVSFDEHPVRHAVHALRTVQREPANSVGGFESDRFRFHSPAPSRANLGRRFSRSAAAPSRASGAPTEFPLAGVGFAQRFDVAGAEVAIQQPFRFGDRGRRRRDREPAHVVARGRQQRVGFDDRFDEPERAAPFRHRCDRSSTTDRARGRRRRGAAATSSSRARR